MQLGFDCDCKCCRVAVYNVIDGWTLGACLGIPDDASIPSALAAAQLVFVGPFTNACASSYAVPAPLQTALKTWVEAGGRLFLTADNIGCFNSGDPGNQTDYNNFLGFLGTGMQLTNNFPYGCPETSDCAEAIPAGVGVMIDLPAPFTYKQGGEISGGTALARTSTVYTFNGCDVPHVFMAAEAIGDGLVIACASSYVFGYDCDATGNCELYSRLCKWTIARILAA